MHDEEERERREDVREKKPVQRFSFQDVPGEQGKAGGHEEKETSHGLKPVVVDIMKLISYNLAKYCCLRLPYSLTTARR